MVGDSRTQTVKSDVAVGKCYENEEDGDKKSESKKVY